jgi:circadian clock protein KaiC
MVTGIRGLDHLLEGGVVRGNSLLIEGPPGSGKSTLGIRMLYEGAIQFNEPGLLVTFEEFPRQVYSECLGHGIDLRKMEEAGKLRVIWTPPQRILEGFSGKNDLIDKIVTDMAVRRLMIDSITHFRRVTSSEVDLRELLAKILNHLKMRGINSILIKELERIDETVLAFEEYLVDASIRVYNSPSQTGGENLRLLEIRKTRGQGHVSGKHPFHLSHAGLKVFPQLRPRDVAKIFRYKKQKLSGRFPTGISGLDSMLMGGVHAGSSNLVVGYPGTGKSVIGYHFIDTGLKSLQPCFLLSIKDTPEEILSQAQSLGMDWQSDFDLGLLRIKHFHPSGLCVEEMLDALMKALDEQPADRFVFDSINDLATAVKNPDRVRDDVVILSSLLRSALSTSLFLTQTQQMGGSAVGVSQDFSDLASCVIQLSMAESDGELRRFVGVRKHTGSDHAKELREFLIDNHGFHVEKKAIGLSGILTGQTHGSLSQVADNVLPSLDEVSETLREVTESAEAPEALLQKLRSARSNLGLLDILLREHFGVTEFNKMAEMMDFDDPASTSPA